MASRMDIAPDPPSLDHARLRRAAPHEILDYFRQLVQWHSVLDVSHGLLSAIQTGALAPGIARYWLTFTKSPAAFVVFLEQPHSVTARRCATSTLHTVTQDHRQASIIDALGGIDRVVALIHHLSEIDVSYLCSAIGKRQYPNAASGSRQADALFTTLMESVTLSTTRPLKRHYLKLLPACSPTIVELWYKEFQACGGRMSDLVRRNTDLFHRLEMEKVFESDCPHTLSDVSWHLMDGKWLPALAQSRFEHRTRFAVGVLRKLAAGEHSPALVHKTTFQRLYNSMAVYIHRKRHLFLRRIKDLSTLVLACVDRHSQLASALDITGDRPTLERFVVSCWVKDPHTFEPILKDMFTRMRMTEPLHKHLEFLYQPPSKRDTVPPAQRYRLLHIFLSCFESGRMDITSTTSLAQRLAGTRWDVSLFRSLPRADANDLLRRLEKGDNYHGLELVSDSSDSLFGSGVPNDDSFALLEMYTDRRNEQSSAVSRQSLAVWQRKAAAAKDQYQRASDAAHAIRVAIASARLPVLASAVQWSERFIKDSLATSNMYSYGLFATPEAVQLVSGLLDAEAELESRQTGPRRPASTELQSAIFQQVEEANSLLEQLLSMVYRGTLEPFFSAHLWQNAIDLPNRVATYRFSMADNFIQAGMLTEPDARAIFLDSTISLLLKFETWSLDNDLEVTLKPDAPLHLPEKRPGPSFLELFDGFFKSRDQLWRKYRQSRNVETLDLDFPWPRGLPLERLLYQCCDSQKLPWCNFTPFITQRAESLVFMPASIAMQRLVVTDEICKTVGNHSENWSTALRIVVHQHVDQRKKEAAVREAWTHALGQMTREALSHEQAVTFWHERFVSGCGKEYNIKNLCYPEWRATTDMTLPDASLPGEVIEWDPAANACPDELPDPKSVLLIDSIMFDLQYLQTNGYRIQQREQDYRLDAVWQVDPAEKESSENRDARIVAALLVLDSEVDTNLLSMAFPSQSDQRFPALFLDMSFLSLMEGKRAVAKDYLTRQLRSVPPTLLLELAKKHLATYFSLPLSSHGLAAKEKAAFSLLRLLKASDQPQLAVPLIRELVLEHPDARSWHRQFLTSTFLKRFGASECEQLVQELFGAVSDRLRGASGAGVECEEADSSAKRVKITTVKYLAQLLNDAQFVSEATSLELLLGLFHKATHQDVRHAILDSLLARLVASSSHQTVEHIMEFLEEIIPLASNANEQAPLTQDAWAQAKANKQLPEISLYTGDSMAQKLVLFTPRSKFLPPEAFARRVILPLLQASTETCRQWTEAFLAKYGRQDLLNLLPPIPIQPALFRSIPVLSLQFLGFRVTESIYEYELYGMRYRGSEIAGFVDTIISHETNDDSVLLFKRLYAETGHQNSKIQELVLSVDLAPALLDQIQSMLLTQAETIVRHLKHNSLQRTHEWSRFTANLRLRTLRSAGTRTQAGTTELSERWLHQCRPVIERIVAAVDSVRTREWQLNPHRVPPVLPDTFALQMQLLWHPGLPAIHRTREQQLQEFADQVVGHLMRIALGCYYHPKLVMLKNAMSGLTPDELANLACRVGGMTGLGELTLADVLRVDFASYCLVQVTAASDSEALTLQLVERVDGLVRSWVESSCEDIRGLGYQVEKDGSPWPKLLSVFDADHYPGRR